jgi:hypothetical protein
MSAADHCFVMLLGGFCMGGLFVSLLWAAFREGKP